MLFQIKCNITFLKLSIGLHVSKLAHLVIEWSFAVGFFELGGDFPAMLPSKLPKVPVDTHQILLLFLRLNTEQVHLAIFLGKLFLQVQHLHIAHLMLHCMIKLALNFSLQRLRLLARGITFFAAHTSILLLRRTVQIFQLSVPTLSIFLLMNTRLSLA